MKISKNNDIDKIVRPPHRSNLFKRMKDDLKQIGCTKFMGYFLGIFTLLLYIFGILLNVEFNSNSVMIMVALLYISHILLRDE